MTHPSPSGPQPSGPGRPAMPTIGMVIRDGERLGAQLLAILNRAVDPASLPPLGLNFHNLATLREVAGFQAEQLLRTLAAMAEVPTPPVGSAVTFTGPVMSRDEAGRFVAEALSDLQRKGRDNGPVRFL